MLTVAKITDSQTHRTRRTMAKHLVPSIDIKYVHGLLDTNTSANAHQYGWGKAHYRMDFVSKSSSNHYGNSRAYVMIYIRCIRDSYFAIENKGIFCRSLARSLCHSLALLFPLSQTHYIHQSRPMFGMCTMDIRIVFHECCVAMRLQHLPGLLYYLVFAAFVRSLYSLCMYTSYTQKLNMKSFLWGNADTIRCRCSDVDMLCFYILYFV